MLSLAAVVVSFNGYISFVSSRQEGVGGQWNSAENGPDNASTGSPKTFLTEGAGVNNGEGGGTASW